MLSKFVWPFLLAACFGHAFAATCTAEDYETKVSGASQCLLMRRFGPAEADTLVVWLHGDISAGGPATYHFESAQQAAHVFAGAKVLSVALVRPGYPDGSGDSSSVDAFHGGRSDHYTKVNVLEVGAAIERLRSKFQPKSLIVIGHSGGAATTALLLGMKPKLMDAAILVACPCDTVAWRAGRSAWNRSENPIKWADKVDGATRVVAFTGSKDDNTAPELARRYIETLALRGLPATFTSLPQETHNSAFRSPEVFRALGALLEGNSSGSVTEVLR